MGKKIVVIFCVAITLLCWMKTDSDAALTSLEQQLGEVRFWVIDDPQDSNDNVVNLSVISPILPAGYVLEYYHSGLTTFLPVENESIVINFDEGVEKELLYLQLKVSDALKFQEGILTFSGWEEGTGGDDWFQSVIVDWLGIGVASLSFVTPGSNDNVAAVPIPGTVLLLGAGLIGLVGLRRRAISK